MITMPATRATATVPTTAAMTLPRGAIHPRTRMKAKPEATEFMSWIAQLGSQLSHVSDRPLNKAITIWIRPAASSAAGMKSSQRSHSGQLEIDSSSMGAFCAGFRGRSTRQGCESGRPGESYQSRIRRYPSGEPLDWGAGWNPSHPSRKKVGPRSRD